MKTIESGAPSGTVTFVVLDVAFSHSAAGGYDGWLSLCGKVRLLVDAVLAPFGGVPVVGRSSNHEFVYAFGRSTKAVQSLVELQRKCLSSTILDEASPELRSAIHTGEVDGADGTYSGMALEQAIGLKDLAYGHQILISLSTQELVRSQTDDNVGFRDLGNHRIQSAARSERVFQVTAPGLPSEFPPLRSLDSAYTNVASPWDSFVGRERELFEIATQLRVNKTLTICGPGGIGKSRVATQIARILLHEYVDGVFVVDFGEVTDGSFVAETIATELPFVETVGVELAKHLREELSKKQILLILDNCDNIRPAVASQAEVLFRGLRSPEVLVTSRKPLGVAGELIYPLSSLDGDDPSDPKEALALLMQRVQEVVPGYFLNPDQVRLAKEICSALRGMPLALELAASKFKILPIERIREQVAGFTDVTQSKRHRDLQEVVDRTLSWTYRSLPPNEQALLRRLSVFANGWELDAAENVCAGAGLSAAEVNKAEALLVQKGIVTRSKRGPHIRRDSLCQSLWQFGHGLLVEAGEVEQYREHHLSWFIGLAERAATELVGPDQHQLIERLDREKHNLRAAIEWCLKPGKNLQNAFKIVLGIHMFWYKRGYITEGKIWLERLLASTTFELSEERARALNVLGAFVTAGGESAAAIPYLQHSLDIARRIGANALIASVNNNLATCYRGQRDLPSAKKALLDSASAFRALGDEQRLAVALSNLGALLNEMGEPGQAQVALEESLELNRRLGNEWAVIMVGFNMAEVAINQNALERAEPLLAQSLSSWYGQKDYRGVALALKSMAVMADKLGQAERAAVLLGASSSIRDRLHQDLSSYELEEHRALVENLTTTLGDGGFFRSWSEGNNLTAEAAVGYAIGNKNQGATT